MLRLTTIYTLLVILLTQENQASDTTPLVKLNSGKVKGLILKSYNGRNYHAFRAIPYGKSTAGQRRFKPPEAVEPWEGTFDATTLGPECPQFNMIIKGVEGTEDCLVINVYTPQLSNDAPNRMLPVMVFIHGGGFVVGTGSYEFYGPSKYMDYDVILVTFNYRLGIFGFFNTEDEVSPGNYGMLDQVLALRWVKENIAKFGGNPEKVTIFGESAGSASVIYHMLSPLSKGLFSSAIAQSGSPACAWAFQEKPLHWAKVFAENIGCFSNDTRKLLNCFKEQSIITLVRGSVDMQISAFFPFYYAPSIERHFNKPFLSEDPNILMKQGRISSKVPLIIGALKDEGYSFYRDIANQYWYRYWYRYLYKYLYIPKGQAFFENEFLTVLPHLYPVDESHASNLVPEIIKEYYGNEDLDQPEKFEEGVVRIFGDTIINVGVSETADMFASAGVPTLVYKYTHKGTYSFAETFGGVPGKYASHADDLYVQFAFYVAQLTSMQPQDNIMSSIINSLWTSFAENFNNSLLLGDTKITWPWYDRSHPSYLELSTTPILRNGSLSTKSTFWTKTVSSLINNYMHKPINKDEL